MSMINIDQILYVYVRIIFVLYFELFKNTKIVHVQIIKSTILLGFFAIIELFLITLSEITRGIEKRMN